MFLVTQDAAHKGFFLLNIPKTFTLFLLINNFERRVLRIERTTAAVHSRQWSCAMQNNYTFF